jgi:transposase
MATARLKDNLKGRKPKLSPTRERLLVNLYRAGDHTISELMELFGVGRATVYRARDRAPVAASTDLTLSRADGQESTAHRALLSRKIDQLSRGRR